MTALFLGRLCDETVRPDAQRVIRVRAEAPGLVDDTVIHFADEHLKYLQVKENIRKGEQAWGKLWADFLAQFRSDAFVRGRDRLVLVIGEPRQEHSTLRELTERADASESAGEWETRCSKSQLALAGEIAALLAPGLAGGAEEIYDFFSHVDVWLWSRDDLQRDRAPQYMPATSVAPQTLFRLLRDRVGGEARRRGVFDAQRLRASLRDEDHVEFRSPPDIGRLREAVRECGALLRQHKHTLGDTGVHLRRNVAEEIIAWALNPGDENPTGVLLDNAGTGKTVVMRDVLVALDERGIAALAIKADQQLSGIESADDLQRKLRLPEPVERVVGRLAALGPMIVIIDQVDALSLSMARDQRALDEVLSLVARLRALPGVVVLVSCRAFDRNTDPRLKRIDFGREFPLSLLTPEEVGVALSAMQVEPETLTPATRELLRTPLHLHLFARIAHSGGTGAGVAGVRTLQDLYGLLWEQVILEPVPYGPTSAERTRALRLVVERMDRDQRISVPRSIFSAAGTEQLATAAEWLASAGVFVAGAEEWALIHQSFFDYCYARFFVEDRRSLADHVLNSDQGLFARPQLVHVLTYLRGTRNAAYLRELSDLLGSERLRVHLRELLLRWLGALPDPTDEEWLYARRLLHDADMRGRVLGAMGSNPAWFARVRSGPLQAWVDGTSERLDQEVVPYLALLVDSAQAEVAEVVAPWVERDGPWLGRLRNLFWRVREWHAPEMIDIYERFLRSRSFSELDDTDALDDIAKADPAAGARLVRIVADAAHDAFLVRAAAAAAGYFDGITEEFGALDGHSVEQGIRCASEGDPGAFLDTMLPWLERVTSASDTALPGRRTHFTSDPLAWWHSARDGIYRALLQGFVKAVVGLADGDEGRFTAACGRLAALPYATPQRLLAEAYAELSPRYASEALRFLTEDARRLDLGDEVAHPSRTLVEKICPFLTEQQLGMLEHFVLENTGRIERLYGTTYDLERRGMDQLLLLQCFPRERLTDHGRARLAELERKFPDTVAVYHPRGMMASLVGPPIGGGAAEKMSDHAWLGAMAKYAKGVQHRSDRRGGARELARVLKERVKQEPERFYSLALHAPENLDPAYAEAFLEGLVEGGAPPELVFDLVHRYAPVASREFRRAIAWLLAKVVGGGAKLPVELVSLLDTWAHRPAGEDEAYWEGESRDLVMGAMNSERGAVLITLLHALAVEEGDKAEEARWGLMDFAASDSSIVFRTAALMGLLHLIERDRERAITSFERIVNGYARLREAHPFHEFLYYAAFRHVARLAPYIEEVMQADLLSARQRGAELATIWWISQAGHEDGDARTVASRLAELALAGPPEWRRGASRIYAHNVVLDGPRDLCVAGLSRLIDDEDEKVRQDADYFVLRLREDHVFSLRDFLVGFASSRSFQESSRQFAEFLWKHGLLDPAWALRTVEAVLDNPHPAGRATGRGSEELVRVVIRIYTDPTSDGVRRENAMNLFDRLMERASGYAWRVLEEWDRG